MSHLISCTPLYAWTYLRMPLPWLKLTDPFIHIHFPPATGFLLTILIWCPDGHTSLASSLSTIITSTRSTQRDWTDTINVLYGQYVGLWSTGDEVLRNVLDDEQWSSTIQYTVFFYPLHPTGQHCILSKHMTHSMQWCHSYSETPLTNYLWYNTYRRAFLLWKLM